MKKTWQDSLRICLSLTERISMTYNTRPGPLCNMLVTETRDLINLLPEEYNTGKKFLAEDLIKLPDKRFWNAYAYGRLQRDLQYLSEGLEKHATSNSFGTSSEKSAKKIFISHSSKDKIIVEAFTNLLRLGANISHDDIFCTSIEEMKIKNGEDIRQHIQNNVNFADFAILLISPNYKQSEICLNEMGAVWAINKKVKTYVLPGLKESKVGWLIDTKAAEKINDMTALASLYDTFVRFYNLSGNTELWTAQAMKFCNTLKSVYKEFESSFANTQAYRGEKSELVINVINSFTGTFTVRQIEQECPGVCRALIRKIMKQHDNCLECTGKGPAVVWRRVKVLPFREDNSKGNRR